MEILIGETEMFIVKVISLFACVYVFLLFIEAVNWQVRVASVGERRVRTNQRFSQCDPLTPSGPRPVPRESLDTFLEWLI